MELRGLTLVWLNSGFQKKFLHANLMLVNTTSNFKPSAVWVATPMGSQSLTGEVAATFRSLRRERVWVQPPITALPYRNRVLGMTLHSLFLLSCPTALKACPAQAATLHGCCENNRDGGNGVGRSGSGMGAGSPPLFFWCHGTTCIADLNQLCFSAWGWGGGGEVCCFSTLFPRK